MNAGPELDRRLAEKVMGWHVFYQGPEVVYTKKPPSTERQTVYELAKWSPSTNITHAWEVVEKMGESFVSLFLSYGKWSATCWVNDFGDVIGTSASAPHAICLAALKAVGGGE